MSDLFEPQEGNQQNSNVDSNQEQQTPQAQESNQGQSVDPSTLFADQLAAIKNEDGRQKYADVGTALGSLAHAQNHIKSLEQQVAALQEQANKAKGMEEVLERIQATQQTNTEQPSVNSFDAAQLDEILAQKLDQTLTQREQARIASENEVAFSNKLKEMYGEKAREKLFSRAQEEGIPVELLQALAQKSPNAALKYFEGGTTASAQPTTPASNTASFTAPAQTSKADEARAKLFGQNDPNIDKWRSAGSNLT